MAWMRAVFHVARLEPFDNRTEEGRSLERYRRIVVSTGASIGSRVVAAVVGLVTVPLVIGYLGKDLYGLWAAVGSLVPWVGLFDPGITAGLVNALAEAHGRDAREDARSYFSTAFFALLGVQVVLAILLATGFAALPWASLVSGVRTVPPALVRQGLEVAAVTVVASLPLGLVWQVHAAFQRGYVVSLGSAAASLLSLGFVLAAVALHASFPVVLAATMGSSAVVAGGALALLVVRDMPWIRPAPGQVTRRALRRLLTSAVPLYAFQLGSLLVNQSQQIVLARRAGLAVVAEYDVLFRLYLLAIGLITLSTASFAPSFREAVERGEAAWVRRSFWHLVRLRVLAAGLGALGMLVGGNWALRLWLGRPDFQYGPWTWVVLSVLLIVAAWASSFLELMMILDRIWPLIGVVLAQGAATMGLTWILGATHGVLGALLAMTIPAVALTGWMVPRMSRAALQPAGPSDGAAR